MFKNKLNTWESIFLYGGTLITLIILFIGKDYSWLTLLATISTITNIACVVLCAKKKISNYLWGTIGVVSYGIVAFVNGLTGEWMLNLIYYLPMQLYGYLCWKKNLNQDKTQVVSRELGRWGQIGVAIGTVLSIFGYAYLISLPTVQSFLYGTVQIYEYSKYLIDASAVMLSVWAMILMTKCYKAQWMLWIMVNILTVILWIIAKQPIVVVQWSVFLANSIYGLIKWRG